MPGLNCFFTEIVSHTMQYLIYEHTVETHAGKTPYHKCTQTPLWQQARQVDEFPWRCLPTGQHDMAL